MPKQRFLSVLMKNLNYLLKFITNFRPLLQTVLLVAVITTGLSLAQGNESGSSSPSWTWQIFGDGFHGGSAVIRKNEVFIDANWLKSSWGLGISYRLEWPEENRELDRIQIQIKTVFNSDTKALAGISSSKEGNKEQAPSWAQTITNEWQTFEFAISGMPSSRSSGRLAPSVSAEDPENVHIINFYFLKPEGSDLVSDTIVVRDLVLTFRNGESYAYQAPN